VHIIGTVWKKRRPGSSKAVYCLHTESKVVERNSAVGGGERWMVVYQYMYVWRGEGGREKIFFDEIIFYTNIKSPYFILPGSRKMSPNYHLSGTQN